MLTIARNTAADTIRLTKRNRRLLSRLESEARQGPAGTHDHSHGLDDLVARLEPERRDAFVLTQVVGCSYQEAAEVCGVKIGTIRSRVARAREQLVEQVRATETG